MRAGRPGDATVAGLIVVVLFALVRRFAMPVLQVLRLENLSMRAVSFSALHWFCLLAGLVGIAAVAARRYLRS